MNASSEIQLQWEAPSAFCHGLPPSRALPGPSSHLKGQPSSPPAHNGWTDRQTHRHGFDETATCSLLRMDRSGPGEPLPREIHSTVTFLCHLTHEKGRYSETSPGRLPAVASSAWSSVSHSHSPPAHVTRPDTSAQSPQDGRGARRHQAGPRHALSSLRLSCLLQSRGRVPAPGCHGWWSERPSCVSEPQEQPPVPPRGRPLS